MAGNFFDQFDEGRGPLEVDIRPQRAAQNFFDQFDDPAPVRPPPPRYDPMAVAVQSLNASAYAQDNPQLAQASMLPKLPDGAGDSLYQSHVDTQAAQRQHAAPLVRDIKGNFVRTPIGEIEEYDFGPVIRSADGNVIAFNPTSDVMLRDPQSGKLMAFERSKELDNPNVIARAGQALLPGMVAGPPTRIASSNAVPMAVQRGAALGFPVPARTYQLGERARDAAAFTEAGVDTFAPAFRSKGAARFARTVEEMPVLGGIVKTPKTETELALREAQARIAADLGAAPTDEAAGRVLQGGLNRFRTAGVQELEPTVVGGLQQGRPVPGFTGPMPNVSPWAAAQRQPLASRGSVADATAAAPIRTAEGGGVAQTSRGLPVPAARRLDQTYRARQAADEMSDAELAAFVGRERVPVATTSFASRQEALFEEAWRRVPTMMRADGSANPNMIPATNTRAALGNIDAQIASQIGGQTKIGGPLADRLRNAQAGNFQLDALRAIRTEVGRAIGSLNPFQTTLNGGQLKQLYAAISRDIESGLLDLANRAYVQSRVSNNRSDYVTTEVARRADEALRKFRVADRYTRLGMARMDRFSRVLGADSPEAAMRSLGTRMKEGTIDRGLVRAVTDALRPEERNQVFGYLVARMGQGRPGAKEAEVVWNLHTFATDWNTNKVALGLLARGAPANTVRQLNALAKISERMKYYETTKNYSGSAYAGIPFMGVATAAVGGGALGVLTALAGVGGIAALGKFLTTPKYLDWMVQAVRTGSVPSARGPQVGGTQLVANLERLRMIAANDNELGPVITQALTAIQKRAYPGEPEQPQNQNQRGYPEQPVRPQPQR